MTMTTESMPAVLALSEGLGPNAEEPLPHAYLLAKLAMVMPLFQEARDALTAIREDQRVRHGISKTLADRMDIAGTFSLDDWEAHERGLAAALREDVRRAEFHADMRRDAFGA
jgi:hypothetical protein